MEHAEPELERTARRLRRVVLAFRVIFYSGAVLILVLVLLGGGPPASDVSSTWIGGRTDQQRSFTMRLDDARPGFFETSVIGTCADGYRWTQRWIVAAKHVPIEFDGRTLTVTQKSDVAYNNGQTGELTMHLQAEVEGGAVTGKLWLDTRLAQPGGAPHVCQSGPVEFSAAT